MDAILKIGGKKRKGTNRKVKEEVSDKITAGLIK